MIIKFIFSLFLFPITIYYTNNQIYSIFRKLFYLFGVILLLEVTSPLWNIHEENLSFLKCFIYLGKLIFIHANGDDYKNFITTFEGIYDQVMIFEIIKNLIEIKQFYKWDFFWFISFIFFFRGLYCLYMLISYHIPKLKED